MQTRKIRVDNSVVQQGPACSHFTWHPSKNKIKKVLRWGEKNDIHLSQANQRLALSAAKILIKVSCSCKMKDGHLLSQHAVSGGWKRGRGGREGRQERRICENMCLKRKRTERGRPWASAVKHDSWNVCCTSQGYTPLALSLLRIHTVFMQPLPIIHWVTHLSLSTCCDHRVVSQFNNPDTASNAVSSVIQTHNTYWWRDMFWTAHLIPPRLLPFVPLWVCMSMYAAKLALNLWPA